MAKRLSLLLMLMLFGSVTNVYADSFLMLKDVRDLPKNRVLVLMAEVQDCSFCIRVKDEHLLPLTKNKEWSKQFYVRRIDIDSNQALYNFNALKTSQKTFAQTLNADFAPTLIFLDPRTGKRIGEDIIGLATPDFYGFYLQKQISQAYGLLQH
jgi:thioredoxin-related protein